LPIVQRIHLEGLDRVDVSSQVAAMLGRPAPVSLVDEVVARGQGNPFFTQELIAAHLAGDAIPAVVSDLIAADTAQLDEQTRGVLCLVAAIGGGVGHDLLMKITDLDERVVERAIRVAADAQLVVVDNATDTYRFRHPLIGEVVYAELLPSERRRLHRAIADVLLERRTPALPGADGELAFHLDRAGDRAGAFVALLAAADESEAVAPGAALRLLDRALELWDDGASVAPHENRVHRLWQAAELANGTVDNARAVQLARAAMNLGPPPRGAAWGHERLGRYLWAAGRHAESAVEFERAATLLAADHHRADSASALAGLAQAELMLCHYESAERLCRNVFELVPTANADPSAWVMARRLFGVLRSVAGDPDSGVEYCREAVRAAETAQTRAFAALYLAHALLDAAQYHEAVNVALDAVVDAQLAGIDANFGGYLDALAAEGLVRLGRWSDADNVLARHVGVDPLPVGHIRLCRAGALLAARRGDHERADSLLADARAQPTDPFHQALLESVTAEAHLAARDFDPAATVAERGWAASDTISPLWMARFAMLSVRAEVEQVLDARAHGQSVAVQPVVARLCDRLEAVEAAADIDGSGVRTADIAAHHAYAAAMLSRIGEPNPDPWSNAARLWEEISAPWETAHARLHEAEAAASIGAMSRAAAALQSAQRTASELGATPLLDEIAALSRRTRLSLEAPAPKVLGKQSINQLGLTSREAEVLTLVAVGQTNRQIGEALYVSEKTASVHVSNILRKLGVTSRVDAAAIAQRVAALSG
jgi:DNA-binding CsgD family transcriptional regulator/tetratricopeptide (TPR) repeat protein